MNDYILSLVKNAEKDDGICINILIDFHIITIDDILKNVLETKDFKLIENVIRYVDNIKIEIIRNSIVSDINKENDEKIVEDVVLVRDSFELLLNLIELEEELKSNKIDNSFRDCIIKEYDINSIHNKKLLMSEEDKKVLRAQNKIEELLDFYISINSYNCIIQNAELFIPLLSSNQEKQKTLSINKIS